MSKYALGSLIAYLIMLLVSPNIAAGINEHEYEFAAFADYIWFYWLFAILGSLNEGWPCLLGALFAFGVFWGMKKGTIWKDTEAPLKDQAIMHVSLLGITTLPTILFGFGVIPYVGP